MFEQGTDYQLMVRIGLILLLGFLVGIERGWSLRKEKESKRPAGIRTFTLIALAGGLWGILSGHIGEILMGFALLGFVLIILLGYYLQAKDTGSYGLTTEMAAFVTFAVGVAVIKGFITLSVSVTILMVLILSIKPKLHKWVKTIEPREIYSGIVFLIISAVLLPLLPNRGFGPWQVLNPFELWGMVVLIAGISYAGYFSMKYLGGEKGILFTSFTGSLVSSIAVTVTLGRFTREMESRDMLTTGVLISTFTALARILLWVIIFNPELFLEVGISILLMIAVTLAAALWVWLNSEKTRKRKQFNLRNPLQFSTAVQFGIVLAVVMLLAEASRQWFGDPGIYGLSMISGMIDIDSITLSLLQMGGETLSQNVAANAVILAAMTNSLIKGAIFIFFAGFRDSKKLVYLLIIIASVALPGLFLL